MISIFTILTPAAYFAAIYFGAKFYNYDIDSFIAQRSYDAIFLLSYVQIIIRNNKYYKNFANSYKKFMKGFQNEIDIILNNKIVQSCKKTELLDNPPQEFDMIIYKCENEHSSRLDNILFFSVPETVEHFEYNWCSYTFIQTTLIFFFDNVEHTYKLNLRDEGNNYYIVGNRLNAIFLSYLLFKNCNISCDLRTIPWTLVIMDQNVRSLHINNESNLIFHDDNYEIINLNQDSDVSPDSVSSDE